MLLDSPENRDAVIRILELTNYHYSQHEGMPLKQICGGIDGFTRVPDDKLEEMFNSRKEIGAFLDSAVKSRDGELTKYFVDKVIDFLMQRNQFLRIDENAFRKLDEIYKEFISENLKIITGAADIESFSAQYHLFLKEHQKRVGRFIAVLGNSESYGYQDVLNCEYTPELQCSILGINPEMLNGSIIDIGCGRSGSLVYYLRKYGCNAVGIDIMAPDDEGFIVSNWLDYKFETDKFDIIIAHISFSNHLIHHHINANGAPELHIKKFIEILSALKKGGSFYYAPGFEKAEKLAESMEFVIERKKIDSNNYSVKCTRI